jgi:predicted MFS family arabinose efflux permease
MNPSRDVPLLFLTRCLRLVAYGALSVILVLYLAQLGMSERRIGLLLTLTLVGDTAISLFLTTGADRAGRRRTLIVGALLMVLGGAGFALSRDPAILLLAATIGVISPSGNEVGPFLAVEQAALAHVVPNDRRTAVFAWYNLAGYFATASGALVGGAIAGMSGYRGVLLGYAGIGAALAALFALVSPAVEVARDDPPEGQPEAPPARFLGLHRSRRTVFWLAGLFSIDAFAGGFVTQALVAYWFHLRFGTDATVLGRIFFATNILAGCSALAAAAIARRIGLINTMVFTHIPSNLFLLLVPFMPTQLSAVAMLLLRSCLSQMDVPTRQSYVAAVVDPDERSAAAGVTGVARTTGSSLSPALAGRMLASPQLSGGLFVIAGVLKLVYDVLLYVSFRRHRPPEELPPGP